MSKIRVALIGIGQWGPNVARSLVVTELAELVWLCDFNKEALAGIANRYPGVRTTTDFSDVLCDPNVDAVAIATPSVTHHALAKRTLVAGKHVLVEKPMTSTLEEAEDLLRIAKARGLVLMVGHVFQYNAAILALKDLIHSGELGEIYYMSFERTNLGPLRTDVNVLWDLVCHDISIICILMGRPPDFVSATGRSFLNSGIEDVIFATFAYAEGPCAHVHASWLSPLKVRQLNVVGREKMAIWDDLDPKAPLKVIDKRVEIPSPGTGGDTYLEHKTLCVCLPERAVRPGQRTGHIDEPV